MVNKEKKLYREIQELTTKIQKNYPELTKYLEEMPNTIPNHLSNDEGLKPLQAYKNSLDKLLEKYEKGH